MGRFSELSTTERVGEGTLAGRPAEAATERVFAAKWDVSTYGMRDVDTDSALVARLGTVLASTPDYVAKRRGVWGGETPLLIEAQGCEEGVAIVKARKVLALLAWQHFLNVPVVLAIYERASERLWVLDLPALLACLRKAQPFVLDAGTKHQKLAWHLPLHLLNEHIVVDAGAAAVTAKRRVLDLEELRQAVT